MKKNTTSPLTPEQFDALYWANRAAPDHPSAEVAYWRTEAAVFMVGGVRMYASYNSFKVNLHKRNERRRRHSPSNGGAGGGADPKAVLTGVLAVINTYLSALDMSFLVKYHAEINQRAQQMEAFGPMNGTYDPAQLQHLKATASQLAALIQYIQNLK